MKPEHKTWLTRGALAVALLAVLALAWKFARPPADDGAFVRGNGRIEATEVDIAAKAAGRVAEILVNEGDFVKAGDVIAKMDTRAIDAQLAQARAQVANARSARQTALALVAQRKADAVMAVAVLTQRHTELEVAKKTSARSKALLADRATSAQQADEDAARASNAAANVAVAEA